MRSKEIIQLSSAYMGVVIGTVIVQFVLQGRIEYVLNKLIMAVAGYFVAVVVYILIAIIHRKKL